MRWLEPEPNGKGSVESRQPEDVRRSHEAGFARHLTKPFDTEDLENVIQEILVAPAHLRRPAMAYP